MPKAIGAQKREIPPCHTENAMCVCVRLFGLCGITSRDIVDYMRLGDNYINMGLLRCL